MTTVSGRAPHLASSVDPGPIVSKVDELMRRSRFPGVAIGLLHGGVAYAQGFGVTSVDDPLPVDADTIFRLNSMSKPVTATALMRLADTGVLDIDRPLSTYLPGLRLGHEDVANIATPRHLLSHSAGLGEVNVGFDLGGVYETLESVVDRLADLPQLAVPGVVWSYSQASFVVAGRLLEVVTGISYEDAVGALLFTPARMERSVFFPEVAMTYRLAQGHTMTSAGPAVSRPWPWKRWLGPPYGLSSSVNDLLRFARIQLGTDEAALLSTEARLTMRSPQGPHGEMGVSWFLRDIRGELILHHGGGSAGYMSNILLVPGRDFALVILTNGPTHALDRELTSWVLSTYLDIDDRPVPRLLSVRDLAEYVGVYRGADRDIEVELVDDVLNVRYVPRASASVMAGHAMTQPMRIALYGSENVLVTEGPLLGECRGRFLRDESGQVAWLRLPTVAFRRVGR